MCMCYEVLAPFPNIRRHVLYMQFTHTGHYVSSCVI